MHLRFAVAAVTCLAADAMLARWARLSNEPAAHLALSECCNFCLEVGWAA